MDNNNGQNQNVQGQNQGYPQQDVNQQFNQAVQGQQLNQTDPSQQYIQQPQQGYPQYDAQGAAQPNMYAQPQFADGNGGDIGKPKKEKKPLGKGAVAGIICGGVALVAAIVCAIIFLPKSDRDVVLDAFSNTFGASESTDDYMEETFGSSELEKKITETGSNVSMTLKLDSVQGTDDIGDFSISLDSNRDALNKEASSGYVISYNGTEILSADGYTDNTDMYIAVENLFSGYLTLPCEDGLTAFAESALGEALELNDAGLSGDIKFFEDGEDTPVADDINADFVAACETAWDNTVFKKVGKTKVDVNGETVTAKQYTVTLGEEDLENVLTELFDAAANGYSEYEELGDGVDADTYQSYIDQAKALIPSVISEDFVLNVYIADGKVVKMTSDASANIMGVKIGCTFDMDINDDLSGELEVSAAGQTMGISCDITDYKNSPNGDITLSILDEDTVVVEIESDNSVSDDKKVIDGSITCYYEDDQLFKVSADWTSDRSTNSFNGAFGLYGEDSSEDIMSLSFDGQIVDIVKGEGYSMELNNISVSSAGEELFGLSAEYSIGTEPQVAGIDSSLPTYDLTTMSEADFAELLDSDLFNQWLLDLQESGLAELFGTGDSSAIDYYDEDDYYDDYEEDDYTYEDESDDEMTNVLLSYDGNLEVEILGTIQNLDMSYGCEYFVDFEDENYDISIEYCLEEDTTTEELLNEFSYYDEDSILDSSYNQSITISDGAAVGYDMLLIDFYGENCLKYYFVRDLGNGYVLTVDFYDYTNSISVEEAAEVLAEQYFSVK